MKIVTYEGVPHVVLREREDWGVKIFDLVSPPRRLWADQSALPPLLRTEIDPYLTKPLASPAEMLSTPFEKESWTALSRRALARLEALTLLAEDPQRRLDAREVVTLAHQVSLVRHILDQEKFKRVLIADEVGLGKTVETALIIKELLTVNPGLRVLYLAPARLVTNVSREFRRMGMPFREWKSQDSDGNLEKDDRLIASIHRAIHPAHRDKFIKGRPWDVLIVDECHHLSDWALGGGDPVVKYKLVRDLVEAQGNNGYLFLLSGTPHQANKARFENLLKLLLAPGEQEIELAGRVIFRTKDDVRDWNDNPLFPLRQVNNPIICEVGDAYRAWLSRIHSFFTPNECDISEVKRRAAGWRCAQALQWATSSPNAGLGYLIRQAIRNGWELDDELSRALAAMRPYRMGARDEPLPMLYQRIRKEVQRQIDTGDLEDIEEDIAQGLSERERTSLANLIRAGVDLVTDERQPKWESLWNEVISVSNGEKIVLFAQPIETVLALAAWLERRTGIKAAIIIGGQTDAERDSEVRSFSNPNGPQFLISSRAGGEGINLQFARRLVHLDVPWNPMDMEQRVGRVHRFGSIHTILVDTLIVRDSREERMWAVARQRLEVISRTMVSPDRFELLFSRVMCLVPPEELQQVMLANASPIMERSDEARLTQIVERGFTNWQDFHQRYSETQRHIRRMPSGLSRWEDLEAFLIRHAGAIKESSVSVTRFRQTGNAVLPVTEPAPVVRLKSGVYGLVGDFEGSPLSGVLAHQVTRLGLNIPSVAEHLRACVLESGLIGAAHLRWPDNTESLISTFGANILIYAFIRQKIQLDTAGGANDLSTELFIYGGHEDKNPVRYSEEDRVCLLRSLPNCSSRTKSSLKIAPEKIVAMERELMQELARPSEEDIKSRTRSAVWPILVAHIIK
ncbi:MAG: helicase-related protein [Verrucomicrobiota bacterium]|nr:helicase-related protein [Verrucomicrobiota bacterium]